MSLNTLAKGVLSFCDIDDRWKLVIDPNNVFWSLIQKDKDFNAIFKREILPLYEEVKERLDKQMQEFRFGTNLTSIYINPTDRCNADCLYCYVPSNIRKTGSQMNEEKLEYVLRKSIEYFDRKKDSKTKPVIIFHASEPLLVKDIIFKAISDFSDHFHFGIQTNAMSLQKQDVDFLKNKKVSVGISLDSSDPNINNLLRKTTSNQGTFDKVMQVIDWFDGYMGLNVLSTITKYNVEQLPGFVDFLAERKIKSVLLNPVRCTQKETLSLRPDNKILLKYFIEAVEKAIELSRSFKKIIIANFSNIILGIIAPLGRRLMCDITPCGGARCFITVTANGDFIPCGEFISLDKFRGGNIFNSTIQDAMDSEAFTRVRSRIVEKIKECDICLFRNICGAPCPAEVYALTKNLYEISPYCEFYKELIKYAFKLIAEDRVKYIFREEAFKNLEYEYSLVK
jgi:uncharacterized protein